MPNPYADHFRVIVDGIEGVEYDYLAQRMDALLHKKERVQILCCMECGISGMARCYADERGYSFSFYPEAWTGSERFKIMAENADAIVAFWDGKSRGTKHMIDIANRMGLQVRVDGGWK